MPQPVNLNHVRKARAEAAREAEAAANRVKFGRTRPRRRPKRRVAPRPNRRWININAFLSLGRGESCERSGSPMTLRKRSLSLAGHATSLALEAEFWAALEALAAARSLSLSALVAEIDASRGARPLASACRLAALNDASGRAT